MDIGSTSFANQTPASWSAPKINEMISEKSYPVTDQTRSQTSGAPIAVVQQSPLGSILSALGNVIYLLIFGLGAGIAFGGEMVSIAIIVAIVGVPVVLGYMFRAKYEFYDSELVRVSRSGQRQIGYSQMKTVNKSRSHIVITLLGVERDFRGGRIVVPGDPKLPDGMDLSKWLETKILKPQVKEDDETRTNEADS